ncbi:MAG: glycoside hydrolase N-terminal domain-containing protein, partial [Limnochordia bacterium]
MGHSFYLRYNTPADAWRDAIPLGNGRLGAMVYGHTDIERIQLNDDSLWYGTFIDRNNEALKNKLPEIRRLVLAGDIYNAEEL